METTEVVSQLDPRFRKVWPGMAGNRFWGVRFSRILVVRFDSDQGQGQQMGHGAELWTPGERREHVPGEGNTAAQEPAACQCPCTSPSKQATSQREQTRALDLWMALSAAVRPRVSGSLREGTSRPCARQRRAQSGLRTRRAAVAQTQGRPALCTVAERSTQSHTPRDGVAGRRCGLSALEAESCPLRIPHPHPNMLPIQVNQGNYYAPNMVSPLWLLWESEAQRNLWVLIRVSILITNSENL